jgi:ribonuclease HI
MKELAIYTDGSSLGNPGKGGWGVVMLGNKQALELGAASDDVTNNQMELMATYKAFEELVDLGIRDYAITLYSDSMYVVNGLNQWVEGWKKNNWKTANKKPVLNKDLWEDLDRVKAFVELDNKLFIEHIKAHAGHEHNERADDIARGLAEGKDIVLFSGALKDYKQETA